MQIRKAQFKWLWALAVAASACSLALAQQIEPEGRDAFSQPLSGINSAILSRFNYGKGLFHQEWPVLIHADGNVTGLGPDFNAKSCASCHVRDGRGRPPEEGDVGPALSFVLLMQQDGQADPDYGPQLRDQTLEGLPPGVISVRYETRLVSLAGGQVASLRKPIFEVIPQRLGPPARTTTFGPRMTQQLVGMGLLERIAEEDILANADPEDLDGDGVSGRANRVMSVFGTTRLGRFGWKAGAPDLATQTLTAAKNDIGLDIEELPMQDVGSIDHYVELLGVPKRRISDTQAVARGKLAFNSFGCGACHVSGFTLSADLETPFGGRAVNAYTDLLLHDMGPELADGTVIGLATQREWRTAPLWGIGRTEEVSDATHFLHDGRARNLTEAILWHGGESQKARDAFAAAPADERGALLDYLNSL